MFKVASLQKGDGMQTIKFAEWKQNIASSYLGEEKRFTINTILLPAKYPSGAIVFTDEVKNVRVKLTLSADKFKELMRYLGVKKGVDNLNVVYDVILDKEGNLSVVSASSDVYGYKFMGSYYKLITMSEADESVDWY